MVLTRNIVALFAGCGVAAVLLNMMEPNDVIVEGAERFLRRLEHSSSSSTTQDGILSAVSFANEEAELALRSEFLIHPSGTMNE
jgi:hypothetical protein